MTPPTFSRFAPWLSVMFAVIALSFLTARFSPRLPVLSAAVYSGEGIESGMQSIEGIETGDPREVIGNIVNKILGYVALIAVVMIIIAGLYLILGMGNDTAKETAKKIVIYTIVGLILILLAKAIVMFFIDIASGA